MGKKAFPHQDIVIDRAMMEDVGALCHLHERSFWQGWDEERGQEDESHSPAGYWKYLRAVEHGAI